MKIKYCVCKYETREAEIDDKFAKLAQPYPWMSKNITKTDYDECIDEIEQVTGLSVGEGDADEYIVTVWSAENGETMLEI